MAPYHMLLPSCFFHHKISIITSVTGPKNWGEPNAVIKSIIRVFMAVIGIVKANPAWSMVLIWES
jgi:hypothetical protein